MGFGIIAGALGGAGQGMVNEAESIRKQEELKQKAQSDVDLATIRSNMELNKAKALAMFDEQRRTAPLNRLQAKAQEIANTDVPGKTAEAPMNEMDSGVDKTAPVQEGQAPKEAPRGIIQSAASKPSASEAFDKALEWAQANDIQAYAAGKPLAQEKTITVADGATVLDRKGNVLFSGSQTKADREAAKEEHRDARQEKAIAAASERTDKLIAAQMTLGAMREGRVSNRLDNQERLAFTEAAKNARRLAEDKSHTLRTLSQDPMYSMAKPGSPQYEELNGLKNQIKELEGENKTYTALLIESASGGKSTATKSPANASSPKADPLGLFTK